MKPHSEVTVIGAGIIGSSIAWRLAQAGIPVRLVDAGAMGGEASWAGAGMLAPGGECTQASWWVSMAIESLRLYPRFVEELRDESGESIDFQICGAIESTESSADWPTLLHRAERQREMGIECATSDNGLLYPNDAWVDPRDVVAALRQACERRGVVIVENSPATELESAGMRALVIAAGAWSSSLRVCCNGRALTLPEAFPVKGHLLGYRMPAGSLDKILRRGHTYILQRSNGFTVAGSNEENAGFDRGVNPEICADIHTRAAGLWPALEGRSAEEKWIGFRPGSRTGEPLIERCAGSNVWLAYGHYRNGILMAPATAQRIAGEIRGAGAAS